MFTSVLLGAFVQIYVLLVCGQEYMIGPGQWKIYHLSYKECDVNELIIDFQQIMLNRTHYTYNGKIKARVPLDDGLAVKMDICKFMDGGCKQYQVLTDNSYMAFANKFARENIKNCLMQMGVNPPTLPLPPGEYKVENFMLNIAQFPENFTYGHYISETCAMKFGMPVGCIVCECEFSANVEESNEEDDNE